MLNQFNGLFSKTVASSVATPVKTTSQFSGLFGNRIAPNPQKTAIADQLAQPLPNASVIGNVLPAVGHTLFDFAKGLASPFIQLGTQAVNDARTVGSDFKNLFTGSPRQSFNDTTYKIPVYGEAAPLFKTGDKPVDVVRKATGSALEIAPYFAGVPEVKSITGILDGIGSKAISDITGAELKQFAGAYAKKLLLSSITLGSAYGEGQSLQQNAGLKDSAINILKSVGTVAAMETTLAPVLGKIFARGGDQTLNEAVKDAHMETVPEAPKTPEIGQNTPPTTSNSAPGEAIQPQPIPEPSKSTPTIDRHIQDLQDYIDTTFGKKEPYVPKVEIPQYSEKPITKNTILGQGDIVSEENVGKFIVSEIKMQLSPKTGLKEQVVVLKDSKGNIFEEPTRELRGFKQVSKTGSMPLAPQEVPTPKVVKSVAEKPLIEPVKTESTPITEPAKNIEAPPRIEGATKSASDINTYLVKQGIEALPAEQQAKFQQGSYKETASQVAELMDKDIEATKQMATGKIPVDSAIKHPEILFNAIEAWARKNNDYQLLIDLANSPVSRTSEAGATLGSHGFNDNSHSPVDAIKEIKTAREKAATNKNGDLVKAKDKTIKQASDIVAKTKATRPKLDWNGFVDSIAC